MAGQVLKIRRKARFFGGEIHIHNNEGDLLRICRQKALRLREDIRVYTDEASQSERLKITPCNRHGFTAVYDVINSRSDQKVGSLRRHGFRWFFSDRWTVLDEHDTEIGTIEQDKDALAFVCRALGLDRALPQTFYLRQSGGAELAEFHTPLQLFHEMTVKLHPGCPVHPLLVLAAGILLVAAERRWQ